MEIAVNWNPLEVDELTDLENYMVERISQFKTTATWSDWKFRVLKVFAIFTFFFLRFLIHYGFCYREIYSSCWIQIP